MKIEVGKYYKSTISQKVFKCREVVEGGSRKGWAVDLNKFISNPKFLVEYKGATSAIIERDDLTGEIVE